MNNKTDRGKDNLVNKLKLQCKKVQNNKNLKSACGITLVALVITIIKYATAYTGTSSGTSYKYGDATYETSGWHSDYNYFMGQNAPFLVRGGSYGYGDTESLSGVFYYDGRNGSAIFSNSFRLALCIV